MDVEFGRLKERMETLNMILDDMQVSAKQKKYKHSS
jgi:hypothetical protein